MVFKYNAIATLQWLLFVVIVMVCSIPKTVFQANEQNKSWSVLMLKKNRRQRNRDTNTKAKRDGERARDGEKEEHRWREEEMGKETKNYGENDEPKVERTIEK